MRKPIIAFIVVLIALILIFSMTPLRYLLRFDSYSYNSAPPLNLYSPLGVEHNLNVTNWNEKPPNATINGYVPVESVHMSMASGINSSVPFTWAINSTFWAYYNSGNNMLILVVLVNMSAANGLQIAPGSLDYPSLGFRGNYQYTSELFINLPENTSDSFYMYAPYNSEIGDSPAQWYIEYGNNGLIPGLSSAYGNGKLPANPVFLTAMNMSYFFLNTVSLTEKSSGWAFYDLNYRHSMEMRNASYFASSAFIAQKGVNFVQLNLTGVFYHYNGMISRRFYIIHQEYILPVNIPN